MFDSFVSDSLVRAVDGGPVDVGAIPEAAVEFEINTTGWVRGIITRQTCCHIAIFDCLHSTLLAEFQTLKNISDVHGFQVEFLSPTLNI